MALILPAAAGWGQAHGLIVHPDFAPDHRQPNGGHVLLATVVSIVGSPQQVRIVRAAGQGVRTAASRGA